MAEAPRTLHNIKDLDMRIAANGDWFYQGSKIERKSLVKLFSTVLRIEEDGRYFLQTPVERGEVIVELAPFIAQLLSVEGEGRAQRLIFTTNVEDHVTAGIDNPLTFAVSPVSGEPMAFVDVRNGLKARLNRPVFYQLVDLAVENEDTGALEVWSDGVAFSLAVLEGDDAS
ncbi:MAG: DUF1285 domain-containing protein [Alphaproteobacteria bacterium]